MARAGPHGSRSVCNINVEAETCCSFLGKARGAWKAVRPNGAPPGAQLKPDLVTSRFYTTCFTGVVVPYVCTTGSTVCGK
jgi:hypothetical protein